MLAVRIDDCRGVVLAAGVEQIVNQEELIQKLNGFNVGNQVRHLSVADFDDSVSSVNDVKVADVVIQKLQRVVAVATVYSVLAEEGDEAVVAVSAFQHVIATEAD